MPKNFRPNAGLIQCQACFFTDFWQPLVTDNKVRYIYGPISLIAHILMLMLYYPILIFIQEISEFVENFNFKTQLINFYDI